MSKKWVVFDAMGVIFTEGDDTNNLLVPYIQQMDKKCGRDIINEVYMEASLGNISSYEFWKRLKIANDNSYQMIEKRYLDNYLTIDDQFIEVSNRLKETFNLAILSNDVREWAQYLRERFGLNDIVKLSVISGDVGYRKPSAEIYKILLSKVDANPEDCVFVDDRDKNLIPAQNLGMKVVRFMRKNMKCELSNVITVDSFRDLEKKLYNIW